MKEQSSRPQRKLSKSTILTLVMGGVILLMVLYSSQGLTKHSCEVCLTYDGASACGQAEASAREEAIGTATRTACASLASGMSGSINCSNTPPDRVTCK